MEYETLFIGGLTKDTTQEDIKYALNSLIASRYPPLLAVESVRLIENTKNNSSRCFAFCEVEKRTATFLKAQQLFLNGKLVPILKAEKNFEQDKRRKAQTIKIKSLPEEINPTKLIKALTKQKLYTTPDTKVNDFSEVRKPRVKLVFENEKTASVFANMKFFFRRSLLYQLVPVYRRDQDDCQEYKIVRADHKMAGTCCKNSSTNRKITLNSIFRYLKGRYVLVLSRHKEEDIVQLLLQSQPMCTNCQALSKKNIKKIRRRHKKNILGPNRHFGELLRFNRRGLAAKREPLVRPPNRLNSDLIESKRPSLPSYQHY